MRGPHEAARFRSDSRRRRATMRGVARAVAMVGIVALCGAMAHAGDEAQGAGGKKKVGQGQGWEVFLHIFDADNNGQVTKDEMMAKHPGFDAMDTNKDGTVLQDEVKALPASTKHPNLAAFVSKFDTDKDGKVTLDEFNGVRSQAFDKIDKNHDGSIEKSEFTPAATRQLS
jgi:EF-hand domain pair/EF hand